MIKRITSRLMILICFAILSACSNDEISGTSNKIFGEAFGSSSYNFVLSRAVDGDTFTVTWLPGAPFEGLDMPVRIKGIDTPEINGKCEFEKTKAVAAKAELTEILGNSSYLDSGKEIILYQIDEDKFGRLLAEVDVIDVHQKRQNVSRVMIENLHAHPYTGGKRLGWCQDLAED